MSIKIIDLQELAATLRIGELQLYSRHLNELLNTNKFPFLLLPGAVTEYTCVDGTTCVESFVIEENEAYRKWHRGITQTIRAQLSFDGKVVASAQNYQHLTREQMLVLMQQAAAERGKPKEPARSAKPKGETKTEGAAPSPAKRKREEVPAAPASQDQEGQSAPVEAAPPEVPVTEQAAAS